MALFPALSDVPFISISGSMEHKTLISNFDDLGKEQRKRKWLYPRRMIEINYSAISDLGLTTLLEFQKARHGEFSSFTFIMPITTSETYTGEYAGTGDGEETVFNIPCVSSYRTIYVDGNEQTLTTNYTISAGGGQDGVDSITFITAPNSGARVTVDFIGRLAFRCRFAQSISYHRRRFRSSINSCTVILKGLLIDE